MAFQELVTLASSNENFEKERPYQISYSILFLLMCDLIHIFIEVFHGVLNDVTAVKVG